ncbi:FG-GAP-like repeat-containing protein [Rhodopirellula sp. JC639]|uniref:FG-GAP-like repeat-containing protein n=1 Tax=Stieleria mannarensis TaxID=2755585 RepID=UPI0016032C00|nr:FG-GAP-like repeat-containing protein [Rhodopirellula sp. JC639]
MLAAAVWHNVLSSLDVNNSGAVSPLDALVVLNEIARGTYVDANTGELDSEVPDDVTPPFIDVNCDSLATPRDALFVLNNLAGSFFEPQFALTTSGAISDQSGRVVAAGCHAQLVEGDSLRTEITTPVPITRSGQGVRLTFDAPEFDRSSDGGMQDAVEISVTDGNGQTVTQTYTADRQSAFNWSENTELATGSSSAVTVPAENSGQPYELTVNLAHLPIGQQVDVTVRLVNNDGDSGTSVVVRDLEIISGLDDPSEVYASANRSVSNTATIDFDSLVDLSNSVQPSYGRTSYSTDRSQVITELVLTNRSNQTIAGDLVIVLDQFTNLDLATLRPDGLLPDGRPFFNLTPFADGPLGPGESTRAREVRFTNPGDEPFQYRLLAFGDLNRAPERFISSPTEVLQSGDVFRYSALAIDPDGDRLTYSLVAGHSTGLIDATTGRLTWQSTSAEIGSNRFTVRATDPYGLFVDQTFDLQVRDSVQNRPPNFVTDPVTEAIASSGFEVTTVGVGAGPAGAAVISGFRGPRIVTANADDQMIGVYAGENNDRFDDAMSYSTGLPAANGQLFDVGYSIDVGLPAFRDVFDANQVLGLDQGDLNGDGNLDLVSMSVHQFSQNGTQYIFSVQGMFGDGIGSFDRRELFSYSVGTNLSSFQNLILADINGDGNEDILFARRAPDARLFTMLGNGDGTFGEAVGQSFNGGIISAFRVADIDEDGVTDLIGQTASFGSGANQAAWWKGLGDGTFNEPTIIDSAGGSSDGTLSTMKRPHDVADLNDDGHLDFVIAGGNELNVYHGDGTGMFTSVASLPIVSGWRDWVRAGDFNGDGNLDFLHLESFNTRLDLYVGAGDGITFTRQMAVNFTLQAGNAAGGFEPTDIDGDGDLDVIFGTSGSNQVAALVGINDGDGNLRAVEYATPDFSGDIQPNQSSATVRGAMFGDYNSDGVTDFSYFTQSGDFDGVGIRLGTRPGEFGRSRSIPWVENSGSNVAVPGDFDGDGDIDLVDSRNDRTFLNRGDGTFSDPIPASGQIGGSSAGDAADFNLDGLTDFVGNYSTRSTGGYYVALSNGDGTFTVTEKVSNGTFYNYVNMGTADFNGDGYSDFYAKNAIDNYIDFFINDSLNPGFFSRTTRFTFPPGSQGVNVSQWDSAYDVGDFTGDGILDFATAERDSGGDNVIKVVVMAGDGEGNFARYSELAGFDEVRQATILGLPVEPGDFVGGDIDSDGDRDLMAVSFRGTRVFLNDGAGNFRFDRLLRPVGTEQSNRESWLVDFNEDGHLDLFQTGQDSSGPLSVWLGDGTGNFSLDESVGVVASVPPSGNPFADIDGDGHLDFVYATGSNGNYGSDDAVIYAGRRDDLVDLVTVDLNGDGNEEVLAVQEQMDRLQIFVGDNLGGLTRQPDLQTGRAPKAVAVGDLNDDGQFELFIANRASRTLEVFVGDLENGYAQTELAVGAGPIDVETADFDNDGNIDVAVLDDAENALWILSGDGSGTLGEPVAIPLGDRPERFVVADVDGDGVTDAVISLPDSQRVMIVPSVGSGVLSSPVYVNLTSTPTDVAAISLNDDGNLDLAVTLGSENSLQLFYGLGRNQFARPQSIVVGEFPKRITVADADEDGRQDLIVVNAGDATASVIYNRFDPNEVYRYDSEAIDPDDDPLTYAIVDGPGGLIINPQTGDLLWAASPDQVGVHEVTLSADDGRGGVATQSFKIAVEPARENVAPLIATTPVTQIGSGEAFSYGVAANDGDGHPLRYRLLEGPEGATLDPVTGELAWDTRQDSTLSTFLPRSSTGYVRTPVNDSLQPESITVEGWFNWTALPAGNGADYLFSRSNNAGYAYGLSNRFNNTLRFEAHTEGGYQFYDLPFSFDANRWYHFAISIDDSTNEVSVYANGQSLFTRPLPGSIDYSNRNPGIHDSFFQFQGATDNYRIWNTARDAQQIREGLNTQYENEPSLVLDYRFGEKDELTVRDYSGNENHGYRVTNGNPPGAADGLVDPGPQQFSISVEDGRGGFDVQTFTLHVLPDLRGSITGRLFNDLNDDGVQDDGSEHPAEPGLDGWRLFIDSNDNGFADPHEHQTSTDASGDYRFEKLLPGEYAVRIEPVAGFETPSGFVGRVEPEQFNSSDPATSYDLAINALTLSQIRGQLKTEDDTPIAFWKVFADLDQDGQRDPSEPMAISDRDGHYALAGLSAGDYKLLTDTPAGWIDAAAIDGLMVTLGEDEVNENNDFVLRPTNTSVAAGLHFVTTAPSAIEARETFTYASVAMAINEAEIQYDLPLAPEGMVVDPATGLIAWRPTIAQVGSHTVILRAVSGDSVAMQDFTVDVTAPNFAPVVTRLPGRLAYLNQPHQFDIAAQDPEQLDPEQQPLTFTLSGQTHGASIDADSGRMTWIPDATGPFEFLLQVADGEGAVTEESFTIEVSSATPLVELVDVQLPRNRFPVSQQTIARIAAMDSLGRDVDWTINDAPSGLMVQADGTIRWTPSSSQLGEHSLTFVAVTADGTELEVDVPVSVVGSLANAKPQIQSSPILAAVVDQRYIYDLEAVDPDRDPLSYALLDGPAGMSLDPVAGTLRWTPAEDQRGEHEVVIRVADTFGAETIHSFKLVARRFGGPPVIQSVPDTEAAVGNAYFYSVIARDAENDPLAYRLLNAPAGMSITETTGEIVWTPGMDQVGSQTVAIEVSDGVGGTSTQTFAIRVNQGAANAAPVIHSNAPRFAAVGSSYQYTIDAVDPEGTQLSYLIATGPADMAIDLMGRITWTPGVGTEGKVPVTIRVVDEGGAAAIESFEIDVLGQNLDPVIDSSAPAEATAGALYRYDVLTSDANLDPLTYELTQAPASASIDAFGRIRWTPTVSDLGDHSFDVTVRDPRGGSTSQSFTLTVIEDSVAPRVSLIEVPDDGSRNILPWQGPFVVYAKAIDNVEVASLTLEANGQDIPLSAAGTATFQFEDWFFETITATATAIDTSGNVSTETISFNYDVPEGWSNNPGPEVPTAIITSPADNGTAVGMVSITGTADHENFGAYTLSYRRADETSFTEILRSTTPVVDGELGVWDTSLLLNDEYVIRLQVATTEGTANVVEHHVGLAGELKLGNFQLSFTDMVIPVAGIPIEITRIYDTLQADRQGDFGYGWRLEYRDTDLRVGLPASGLEDIGIYSGLRPGVKVFLNIPGQGRQGFTFNPDIRVLPGWGGNNLVLARPRFIPDPGVTSTLSTGTSNYLHVNEQGELYAPGGIPYNPASPDFGGAYVVTTRDGIRYRVEGASGQLTSAQDRNGNTLTFGNDGVRYGDQVAVAVDRDARGRIIAITDPSGASLTYGYDNALLTSFSDRTGVLTKYLYDGSTPRRLSSVVGPSGEAVHVVEYDVDGRVSSLSDAVGNLRRLTQNPDERTETVIDATGREVTRTYDNAGRVINAVSSFGDTTEFVYDDDGNLLKRTDVAGQEFSYAYNAQGFETQRIGPLGETYYRTYDMSGNITSATDALGNVTKHRYDPSGNRVATIDPLGALTQFTVNAQGDVIERVDSDGARTTMNRDESGRVLEFTDPMGRVTRRTFDSVGRQLEVTAAFGTVDDPRVGGYTFEYDAEGRRLSATLPDGSTTTTDYDANGQPVRSIDELGNAAEVDFDGNGNIVAERFADGTSATYEYDGDGNTIRWLSRGGLIAEMNYDERGFLAGVRYLDDEGTETYSVDYTHDALARQTKVSVDGELIRQRTFDSSWREATSEGVTNFAETTQFDAAGRPTRLERADGTIEIRRYDAVGRLVAIGDGSGGFEEFRYDSVGNRIAQISRNGGETRMTYDASRRLTSVTDPAGGITRYEYDLAGNIIQLTAPGDVISKFEYDRLGRVVSQQIGDQTPQVFSYDAAGNRVGLMNADGSRIEATFDSNGNELTQTASEVEYEVSYTAAGRVETVRDARGTTRYEYDSRQRLILKTDPDGETIAYDYDSVGRVVEMTTSFGSTRYEYDADGQVARVIDPSGDAVSYTYAAAGKVASISYPNGMTETRSYNDFGRPIEIAQTLNGAIIDSYRYSYHDSGQISSVISPEGRREYRYDLAYRLIAEERFDSNGQLTSRTTYEYDSAGNRVRQHNADGTTAHEYDSGGRLVRSVSDLGETTYAYDADGNLIRKQTPESITDYRWDPWGRLVEIEVTTNGVTSVTQLTYDFQGNLVRQNRDGVVQNHLIDEVGQRPRVVADYSPTGTAETYYTYGIDRLSMTRAGQPAYYHQDLHSGVRRMSGSGGKALATYDYGAFGELLTEDATIENDFLYRAQRRLDGVELDYLRTRFYSPEDGRFVSPDRAGVKPGDWRNLNRYTYVSGDPINNIDPDGEFLVALLGTLIGITTTIIELANIYKVWGEFELPDEENSKKWTGTWETFGFDAVVAGYTYGVLDIKGAGRYETTDWGSGLGLALGFGKSNVQLFTEKPDGKLKDIDRALLFVGPFRRVGTGGGIGAGSGGTGDMRAGDGVGLYSAIPPLDNATGLPDTSEDEVLGGWSTSYFIGFQADVANGYSSKIRESPSSE